MSSFASISPAIPSQAGPSTYSTAFPPLQSTPWNFQHNHHSHHKKHAQHHNQHPALYQSLAPPKYPSYLRHTLYADLALEQYNYYQNRRSFFPSDPYKHVHYDPMPTLAESSKSHPTCVPPEEMDLRLPTCWNQKDKSRHIEIGRNGLDLSYIGPGKNESHAASVRSNFPIRRQCGIYYYEVHVSSKGDDGFIGVGFCGGENELERLPGWDPNSWGYHGDDGNSFAGSGTGKPYGPCFTTGDVVGCGVNFAEGTVFYTKNGSFLGNAFENLFTSDTTEYYPCIGLRTPGERVTVNFGNETFVFDIIQYIKDCKTRCWKDITGKSVPSREKFVVPCPSKKVQDTSGKLDQLVLSYLIHHGYTGAAKAVIHDSKQISGKSLGLTNSSYTNDQDLEQRHSIRAAIAAGNIDLAIELTHKCYPGVLKQEGKTQDILFELKCRKFVEMMREHSERDDDDQTSVISNNSNNNCSLSYSIPEYEGDVEEYGGNRRRSVSGGSFTSHTTTPSVRVPGRRRLSYAAIAASASPTNATGNGFLPLVSSPTEHDDEDHGNGRRHRRLSTRRSSTGSSIMSVNSNMLLESELETEDDDDDHSPINIKRIMKFGQQLQDEYRHDERPKIQKRLVEIFSLLAYPDVGTSPVAHLMNKSGRDELATDLNAAILYHQNRPEMPPLERIYRQAMVVNKELVYAKFGKAVILNVEEHCSSSSSVPTATES